VQKSSESLTEITELSDNVAMLMDAISHSAEEQYQGIVDIRQSVGKLDDDNQQNGALAEETASASQSLDSNAKRLSDMTEQFKVM
jgi:methyl-accepting chemotaxis protein